MEGTLMTILAILLGLKNRPACEPCLACERARNLSDLEALLAEIAEPA